jgi:hypothetical protein
MLHTGLAITGAFICQPLTMEVWFNPRLVYMGFIMGTVVGFPLNISVLSCVKLTAHLHLAPKLRIVGAVVPLPIYLI